MHHQVLLQYCKKSGYNTSWYEFFREEMKLSLMNSRHIMSLTWIYLEDLGFPGAQDVYEFGWEFSLETRRLKGCLKRLCRLRGLTIKNWRIIYDVPPYFV